MCWRLLNYNIGNSTWFASSHCTWRWIELIENDGISALKIDHLVIYIDHLHDGDFVWSHTGNAAQGIVTGLSHFILYSPCFSIITSSAVDTLPFKWYLMLLISGGNLNKFPYREAQGSLVFGLRSLPFGKRWNIHSDPSGPSVVRHWPPLRFAVSFSLTWYSNMN